MKFSQESKRLVTKLREDLSILKGNLLVLIISWIFIYFASSMIHPYESLYLQSLGASPYIIGLIGSIAMLVLCISNLFGAYIADKYGRRKIIATMTFGIALSNALLAIAPDWRIAALGILLSNLCLIYQPALQAITADSIPPEKRGIGYALADVLPSIPAIFAPLIARALISNYGFISGIKLAYWLATFLMLITAIVRALGLKETLKVSSKKSSGLVTDLKNSLVEVFTVLKRMPKSLTILTIVLLLESFEEPIFYSFMPLYAVNIIGISRADWAYLSMISLSTSLIAGLPLGKLVDTIGRRRGLLIAHLLWLPPTLYFIFCRSFSELTLVFIAFAIGTCFYRPSRQALLADLTPKHMRGRIMGIIGVLGMLVMVPSSSIGGYLFEINPSIPFFLCVALEVIIIAIILLFLKEPKRREF